MLLRYYLSTKLVRYTSEADQPSQLCQSGWQILDTKQVQLYSTANYATEHPASVRLAAAPTSNI